MRFRARQILLGGKYIVTLKYRALVTLEHERDRYMSDYLTVAQIAEIMDKSVYFVRNYLKPRAQPFLKHKKVLVANGMHSEARILRADFDAWRAAYEAKPPAGAQLHHIDKQAFILDALQALGPYGHTRQDIAVQTGKARLNPSEITTLEGLVETGQIEKLLGDTAKEVYYRLKEG